MPAPYASNARAAGFYCPDPSHLPALEEHINSLKADRETARAMDAADYAIANMSTEIDAFTRVVENMRHRLAELDPEEGSSSSARNCCATAPQRLFSSSMAARPTPRILSRIMWPPPRVTSSCSFYHLILPSSIRTSGSGRT